MPELICDTTVVQYLHQLGLLHVLPALGSQTVIPTAVAEELAAGRACGIALPEPQGLAWLRIMSPSKKPALPHAGDLGDGECEVLWLAAERSNSIAVLDDGRARQVAAQMNLPLTGTLGLLLDAKRAGLVTSIAPYIDELRTLNFYLSARAYAVILQEAGETS